jgi:hypothetical protein
MTAATFRKYSIAVFFVVLFPTIFYPCESKSASLCRSLTFYNYSDRNMLVQINYYLQWVNIVLAAKELQGFQINCPTSTYPDEKCELRKLMAGVISQHFTNYSIVLSGQVPETRCLSSFQPPTNCTILLHSADQICPGITY